MVTFDVIEALDLFEFYQRMPWVIDGLVYLVFFTGIAHLTVGKRFGEERSRAGAAVSAAVGVALAVGAATLARRVGFSLAEVGGLAWLLLAMVLGYVVFDLCRSCGIRGFPSAMIALTALVLGLSLTNAQGLVDAIGARDLLGLLFVMCVVAMAWLIGAGKVFAPRGAQLSMQPSENHEFGTLANTPNGRDVPHEQQGATTTANRTDASRSPKATASQDVASLLVAIYQHFSEREFDDEMRRLVNLLASHDRAFAQTYRRAVHALSVRRWRASSALTDEIASLMIAARDNVSAFDRAIEVAVQGCQTQNRELFLESLQRLTQIEKQAYALLPHLRNVLQRLEADTTQRPSAAQSNDHEPRSGERAASQGPQNAPSTSEPPPNNPRR